MQTITIGRVGIGTTTGDVTGVVEDGEALAISGRTPYGTLEEALTIRAQLLGYASSTDESFVPVTWGEFPHLDGYYRVASVRVGMPVITALSGIFDWSVTLLPVSGFAAPLIESVCVGKLRASALALTARRAIGVPRAAESYVQHVNGLGYVAAPSEFSPNPDVRLFVGGYDSFVGQYFLPPANFYDGAATLTMGYPERVIVGRQVQNDPVNWRLSNGIFEVMPAPSSRLKLQARQFADGAWSSWHELTLQVFAVGLFATFDFPHTITVLSNSPEAVTIRLVATAGLFNTPTVVDLTLRRGASHFALDLRSTTAEKFSVVVPDMTSAAALTGGWSSGDLAIGSAGALSSSAGTFKPSPDVATTAFSFGFGVDQRTTGPTKQDMLNEYFWAGSEKQTVVAR